MANRAGTVLKPADRALAHLCSLQHEDGSWEGEVVWCTMILSQYVIVRQASGRELDERDRAEIRQHYAVTQTAEGGWGLHPEGPPQVFTTTLAYVALRLVGVGPSDQLIAPARQWLRRQPGGVLAIPTWGKFWLALLGLYDVKGVGGLPPELFLVPRWLPFHPRHWYCHTRYIYLAMAYLYGREYTIELGPLRDALRAELYDDAYDRIDFAAHRNDISPADLYARRSPWHTVFGAALTMLSRRAPRRLRRRALADCFERILHEQRASRYQALSPVNGLLNCLAILSSDPSHPDLEPSLEGVENWRWCDGISGTRYAGARSQVWDTAFAARALLEHVGWRDGEVHSQDAACESLRRAHGYLVAAQMQDEVPAGATHDRDPIIGGWCFSDGRHRWPVSDCTAEALTAVLEMEKVPGLIPDADRISIGRVTQAIEFLLARQNDDGGFSTYEPTRGPRWLDRLNPSEMFRDCMTEHSYVECTASAVEAMATVQRQYPEVNSSRITTSLNSAIAFIRQNQLPDGRFPAAWGICFIYSIFHVVKALRAVGLDRRDPSISNAVNWLKSVQRSDGGWGEHYTSCLTGEYVPHPQPQPVMTSWALLALSDGDPDGDAVGRGRSRLESMQSPDGSWPRGAVNGVFFGTAMLDYRLYHAYFPAWALARDARSAGL